MTKKKILIMSASIGTGHTQAARAIEEYVQTLSEEYDVEHLDFLSNDVLSIDNLVKETYIKILDFFPMLYDLMYYSSQGYKRGMAVKTLIAWGLKRRMLRVLADRKPDILVFTHPFPAGAAALLKRQHRLNIPLVGVITDFAVHQLWLYPQIDLYCVAASQLKDLLNQNGIDRNKIIVSGIPVRNAFKKERWHMKEKSQHSRNILIMGGGLGMGSIKQSLTLLDRIDTIDSFTVVTGYNADLYDEIIRLRRELSHPVNVFGYTNQIPELMVQSALLVTKPGALTCTEAATVQLPMVLYSPIPGQEEANAFYMQEKGCARWVKSQNELVAVVKELLADTDKLLDMSHASLACHRDGAEIIGARVLQMLQPDAEHKKPEFQNQEYSNVSV
ncbi:MGDG synthase family glycosyltransferase [Megasphaera cerevisiae]|uniref:MGDG synthase family glycosyltransferase n=1 Tax=Megasphaera cerevisiae TaxID=39029 RepID=UPI000941F0B5|nr:glycosyltransferase [Megasphaera cerevisiae]OKY53675.1 galactosyldiacylglycerol synthase [Megasphaera cerevisiae]